MIGSQKTLAFSSFEGLNETPVSISCSFSSQRRSPFSFFNLRVEMPPLLCAELRPVPAGAASFTIKIATMLPYGS
jgi:hypothetical protein